MGMTYSARIGIGFVFTREEFVASFKKHMPEKAHMEDRYDPKTGAKQLPAKVIDSEAGEYVFFDAQDYGMVNDGLDIYQLTEDVGDFIGNCHCHSFGYEHEMVAIEPKFDEFGDSVDAGNFDIGGDVELSMTEKLRPDLARIAKALKKLGVHQGRIDEPLVPRIFVNWDVG